METFENGEHEWFLERIGAAIAGGLGSERGRFEEHASACAPCAAEWDRAILGDQKMMELFATARPGVGFENAVIETLRKQNPRRRLSIHPVVWRVASAAAAAVVVAGIGYAGSGWVQHGRVDRLFAWGGGTQKLDARAVSSATEAYRSDMIESAGKQVQGLEPTFSVAADNNPGVSSTTSNDQVMALSTATASAQQRQANSINHNQQGQNVVYREGRAQFSKSAFDGNSRDNIYSQSGKQPQFTSFRNQYAANDSVLLPTDDDNGGGPTYTLSTVNNAANGSGTAISGSDVKITMNTAGGYLRPDGSQDLGTGSSKLSDHKAAVGDLVNLAKQQIAKSDYAAAKGVLSQVKTLDPNNEYARQTEQEVTEKVVHGENTLPGSFVKEATISKATESKPLSVTDADGSKFGPTSSFHVVGKTGTAQTADGTSGGAKQDELDKLEADNKKYEAKLDVAKNIVDGETQSYNGLGRDHRVDASYFKPGDVAGKDLQKTGINTAIASDSAKGNFDSPTAPANGPAQKVVTKVYDIRDLLISPTFDPTTNVAGGTMTQGGSGAQGGSGGGGGGLFAGSGDNDGDAAADKKQQLQDLEKKIQNTVAFNTWKSNSPDGNGQIDDFNDTLIINQTPEVQKQISDLIEKVRQGQAPADGNPVPQDLTAPPNVTGGQPAPAPAGPAVVKPGPGSVPAPVEAVRKVIRHGEVTFEVDSFDSAAVQIAKIVEEERGFVSTTDSEKLENGKVSGTITVRVPPDNLDVLVLKLRGLGDLTGQKITADDVTREYTDLQSELRAAQAMEDRLMDIVKTGKGEVKDLVEAEKELGVWREKAEKVTGQINYYNNLVAMSTLQIGLTERNIRQAALANEMETVSAGIETEDVVKAREAALKAIDELKGRVTQSDLKQLDAGEYNATIVAEISPDQSGPLTDRLRQLGRVARMDVGRQQTTANGAPVTPGIKVEKKDTQFSISLYNLANIQPRQTTILNMACADVEKTYADVTARATKAGGRIVNSNLNRPKSDQIDATIRFETPADAADAALSDIRVLGDVMHLTVTENPDTANVTPSKRGFEMTLVSLASVKPRETIQRTLMAGGSVGDAYRALLDAANTARARITKAELQENGGAANTGASLEFEVPRAKMDDIEKAVTETIGPRGKVVRRQSSKTPDTDQMVDSKVGMTFTFVGNDALAARETLSRVLAVPNVPAAYNAIKAAAQIAGAKIDAANLNEAQQQNIVAVIDLVTPRQGLDAIEKAITASKGGVISRDVRQSADMENTSDDKVALMITIKDVQQISPRQTTTLQMQVSDPEKDYGDIQLAAVKAGGGVIGQELNKDSAHVIVDVPLSAAAGVLDQIRGMGTVKGIQQVKDADVPDADFARAVIDVRFASEAGMVGDDTGLWSTLKSGLGTSIRGLLMSLELIVIGLCLIVPWAGLIWFSWKGYRKWKPKAVVQRA